MNKIKLIAKGIAWIIVIGAIMVLVVAGSAALTGKTYGPNQSFSTNPAEIIDEECRQRLGIE